MPVSSTKPVSRRRIRYIDPHLQRHRLLSLVVLECGLVGIGMWFLYTPLRNIIERSMYSAHFGRSAPLLDQLLGATVPPLALFAIVNLLVVLVVESRWYLTIRSILTDFMGLVEKTGEVDFTPDPAIDRRHPLLDIAVEYRASERARLLAIRTAIRRLREVTSQHPGDSAEFDGAVRELKRLVT